MTDALEKLRAAENDALYLRTQYLAKSGWERTCQTPGSIWCWEKEMEDGRTIVVNEALAATFQRHIDEERAYQQETRG